MVRTQGARTFLAPVFAVALAACSNTAPSIVPLFDRSVVMNVPLEFDVQATDPDTEQLTFKMEGGPPRARLTKVAGSIAHFSWVPDPSDLGVVGVTFVVSDGSNSDSETINIKVTSGSGPRLMTRKPQLVPAQVQVVSFTLEYEDDTTTSLAFAYDPDPTEWGAELNPSGKRLKFNWTPSSDQRKKRTHTFVVTASNPAGAESTDAVTIVFTGAHDEDCTNPYAPPQVYFTPLANQSGSEDYVVTADIVDEESDVTQAAVFWTLDPEQGWERVDMVHGERDQWTGAIPNAHLQPGDSATIAYVVCAFDDDDAASDSCDNQGCFPDVIADPPEDPLVFTVSGTASAGLCEPCADGGCANGGICLVNQAGEKFCGEECDESGGCPDGYYCTTVDDSPQCVPNGCRNGPSECSCSATHPSAPTAGQLVINEVLFDPPDACPDGQATCDASAKLTVDVNGDGVRKKDEGEEEFVEILNTSATVHLQLEGVTVSDAEKVRITFPAFVLPPKRAVVVFSGGDPTKFGAIGGAFKFSAAKTAGGSSLTLTNSGDTVTVKLGTTVLDTATWTSSIGKGQSIVRSTEGLVSAPFANHSTASGASGAKFSPGTHVCGVPFPLDEDACVAPSCSSSNTNVDKDPDDDVRRTASCLKPLPQTITGDLAIGQANAADNDPRDTYVVDGVAGKWLHAHTEAGTAPAIADTVVRLLARNGTVILSNDDDPWDTHSLYSRLITQFPSDGVYYLEVTPLPVSADPPKGSYKLVVETSATEPQKP